MIRVFYLPTVFIKNNLQHATETGIITSLLYDSKEMIYNQQGFSFNWYRNFNNDKYTDQNYYPATLSKDLFTYK